MLHFIKVLSLLNPGISKNRLPKITLSFLYSYYYSQILPPENLPY